MDNLLLHYATDHHVIEKIMFCETEGIISELRKELATKDEIMESLLADNAKLEEKVHHSFKKIHICYFSLTSSTMIILPLALVLTRTCR